MRFLIAALLASLCLPAIAADWPHYRGPDYNGISTEDFDPSGLKIAWKADVGIGASSVVVEGDRVITMGNVKDTDVVTCFNRTDGKVLWTYKYPARFEARMFDGGTAATPTIADGLVYNRMVGQAIYSHITLEKGEKVWTAHLVDDFRGKPGRWKYSGSPLVMEGKAFFDVGGDRNSTLALDAKTGKKIWGEGSWKPGYASPIPFDVGGKKGVIIMKAGDIVAHDRKTGDVLWTTTFPARYDVNASSPIIAGDTLFVSNGYRDGKSAAFDLSTGKAKKIWWNDRDLKTKMSTAVVIDGVIYGVSSDTGGEVVAMNLKDGKMLWAERGYGSGHLVAADGKLIVMAEGGELSVLSASPKGEKVHKTVKLFSKRNRSWVQPTLANGYIFAKNNKGELVALTVGSQ